MACLSKAGWFRLETHWWTAIVLWPELSHSFSTLQPGLGFISPHPAELAPFCHLPECLACVQHGWLAVSYAWHLPPLKTGHEQGFKLWIVPCLSKTRHIHIILSLNLWAQNGGTWHSLKFLLLLLPSHSQVPCFHVWTAGIWVSVTSKRTGDHLGL